MPRWSLQRHTQSKTCFKYEVNFWVYAIAGGRCGKATARPKVLLVSWRAQKATTRIASLNERALPPRAGIFRIGIFSFAHNETAALLFRHSQTILAVEILQTVAR
jgi:hypothetical protein